MKNDYLCPKCKNKLNIGGNIVFTTKKENGEKGLILLSQKVGDYTIIHHPAYKYSHGEHLKFFCPICHTNLEAVDVNKSLAKIIMVNEDKQESEIYFSEIIGEKCTYKITDSEIEAFGDHSAQYINFFGEMPRY